MTSVSSSVLVSWTCLTISGPEYLRVPFSSNTCTGFLTLVARCWLARCRTRACSTSMRIFLPQTSSASRTASWLALSTSRSLMLRSTSPSRKQSKRSAALPGVTRAMAMPRTRSRGTVSIPNTSSSRREATTVSTPSPRVTWQSSCCAVPAAAVHPLPSSYTVLGRSAVACWCPLPCSRRETPRCASGLPSESSALSLGRTKLVLWRGRAAPAPCSSCEGSTSKDCTLCSLALYLGIRPPPYVYIKVRLSRCLPAQQRRTRHTHTMTTTSPPAAAPATSAMDRPPSASPSPLLPTTLGVTAVDVIEPSTVVLASVLEPIAIDGTTVDVCVGWRVGILDGTTLGEEVVATGGKVVGAVVEATGDGVGEVVVVVTGDCVGKCECVGTELGCKEVVGVGAAVVVTGACVGKYVGLSIGESVGVAIVEIVVDTVVLDTTVDTEPTVLGAFVIGVGSIVGTCVGTSVGVDTTVVWALHCPAPSASSKLENTTIFILC
eukprot:m.1541988 g.1541988  ORF g.1541988 m.1541988 type:complete len:492 (-) comp25254_c0_seq1:339-1814(-)